MEVNIYLLPRTTSLCIFHKVRGYMRRDREAKIAWPTNSKDLCEKVKNTRSRAILSSQTAAVSFNFACRPRKTKPNTCTHLQHACHYRKHDKKILTTDFSVQSPCKACNTINEGLASPKDAWKVSSLPPKPTTLNMIFTVIWHFMSLR